MIFIQNECEFELHIVGLESGSERDELVWLVVSLRIKDGEKKYRETGPWLTTNEARELVDFFSRPIDMSENLRCDSFIEPNIGFIYDPSLECIEINLELEARPKWMKSRSISFSLPRSCRDVIAKELDDEIRVAINTRR